MSWLEINALDIEYATGGRPVRAVRDVNLSLEEGDVLGIVGESGCGKTTLIKSILGLLPENGRVAGGEIVFDGLELTGMSQQELNEQVRWKDISIIPQNAQNALDPVYQVWKSFYEAYRTHTDVGKRDAIERAEELLEMVDIDRSRLFEYPHRLSGGQRQRVTIALALALDPRLIIADEPTTGLDVIVQDRILDLINDIQEERNNSMIFVSHDISAVAEVADKVAVMYGGTIVEVGDVDDIFRNSTHPYTIGLLNAYPSITGDHEELITIAGEPPDLRQVHTECVFADRCPFVRDRCFERPPLAAVKGDHYARCHFTDEAETFREKGQHLATWERS